MSCDDYLSVTSSVALGDLIQIFKCGCRDKRWATLQTLMELFQAQFTSPTYVSNVTTPADGATLTLTDSDATSWQIIRPAVDLSTYTIVLPPVADVADGKEYLFTTTKQINAITINGNGATLQGVPTVLGAGQFFRLRYEKTITSTWHRVG